MSSEKHRKLKLAVFSIRMQVIMMFILLTVLLVGIITQIYTGYYRRIMENEVIRQTINTGEQISTKTEMFLDEANKILQWGNSTDGYNKASIREIASAWSEKSGIQMDVLTDCPCVQFYAANFVEDEHGKNGHVYNKREAFCLETQVEPNAVNVENFHSPVLEAGEKYYSETVYRFSVRK